MKYTCLKLLMLVIAMSFLLSSPDLCAAAAGGAGVAAVEDNVSGQRAITVWARSSGHNIYGKQMDRITRDQLDLLVGRLNRNARIFQDTLTDALCSNVEFSNSAYLFKRSYATKRALRYDLTFAGFRIVASALGIVSTWYSSLGEVSKDLSYATNGLVLAEAAVSFIQTAREGCSEGCGTPFPSDESIRTEAEKVSWFVTFKDYPNIVARSAGGDTMIVLLENGLVGY